MLPGLNISHSSCLTPRTMLLKITLLSRKAAMLHWPELLWSTSRHPPQNPVLYNNNSRIKSTQLPTWFSVRSIPMSRLCSPPLSSTNSQPAKYSRGELAIDMNWYHSFPPQDFTAAWVPEMYFSHSHISIHPGALVCLLKLEQPAGSVLFKHIKRTQVT